MTFWPNKATHIFSVKTCLWLASLLFNFRVSSMDPGYLFIVAINYVIFHSAVSFTLAGYCRSWYDMFPCAHILANGNNILFNQLSQSEKKLLGILCRIGLAVNKVP